MDESMEEAAMRETLEEVGVIGSVEVSVSSNISILSQVYMFELLPLFFKAKFNLLNDIYGFFQCKLGKWLYMSIRSDIMHEGYMFSLLV